MKARNNFLKKGMMSLALSLCVIATPMSGMSMVASAASEDALYTQDFTDVTDASTVATSTNAQSGLTIETDSTHGNYLSFNLATSGESSSRGGYLNFTNLDVSTRDTYIVEFDASISQTNSQSSSLAVKCTDAVYDSKNVNYGIASGYLIELNCSGSYSNTYTLNDTETVTIPGSVWCHYKLYVNKTLGLVSTTITYDETDSSERLPPSMRRIEFMWHITVQEMSMGFT